MPPPLGDGRADPASIAVGGGRCAAVAGVEFHLWVRTEEGGKATAADDVVPANAARVLALPKATKKDTAVVRFCLGVAPARSTGSIPSGGAGLGTEEEKEEEDGGAAAAAAAAAAGHTEVMRMMVHTVVMRMMVHTYWPSAITPNKPS
jgi:hypothetical protein